LLNVFEQFSDGRQIPLARHSQDIIMARAFDAKEALGFAGSSVKALTHSERDNFIAGAVNDQDGRPHAGYFRE
jgi:hypothetical protein